MVVTSRAYFAKYELVCLYSCGSLEGSIATEAFGKIRFLWRCPDDSSCSRVVSGSGIGKG